jgi:hypothetical protein
MSLPLVQYCDAVALLSHRVFYVNARDFVRYDLNVYSGCEVSIVFYVYEGDSQTASDIIFRVLAPDGREIYPRTKVSGGLTWSFIAGQSGGYTLEFDNTYSLLTVKRVDLAIALTPPPAIVTVTTTRTFTTTIPTYITVTTTFPGIVTIVTRTETIERTIPITIPTYITYTSTTTTTATAYLTTTTTIRETATVTVPTLISEFTLSLIAIAIVVGITIGLLIGRRRTPKT